MWLLLPQAASSAMLLCMLKQCWLKLAHTFVLKHVSPVMMSYGTQHDWTSLIHSTQEHLSVLDQCTQRRNKHSFTRYVVHCCAGKPCLCHNQLNSITWAAHQKTSAVEIRHLPLSGSSATGCGFIVAAVKAADAKAGTAPPCVTLLGFPNL